MTIGQLIKIALFKNISKVK